jgi:hypothetical protein
MAQSRPWKANNRKGSQEISPLSWYSKVHCRVHKSPPMVPILIQVNSILTFQNIILPSTPGLLSGVFPSGFPPKYLMNFSSWPCVLHSSPSHPPRLEHPNIIWRTIQMLSFSLCSFLQPPIAFSLLGPNILNTIFSKTLNLRSIFKVRDQISYSYPKQHQRVKLYLFIV